MITDRAGPSVLVAALMVTILGACGSASEATPTPPAPGEVVWPAPDHPLALTVKAGLKPEPKESLTFHVHAHLDVLVDGRPVLVPAGIGVNITDPAVKRGQWNGATTYGHIAGCAQPCISPLHTHDESGVIHTESAANVPDRLGQFFTEWDVVLSDACIGMYCQPATTIAVYVDGKRYSGKVVDIPLTDRKEIALVIGAPPDQIPSSFPSWAPG